MARGVAQAAVAPQRPVLDPGLIDRHALDAHHAAADHRRDLQRSRAPSVAAISALEARPLVPLQVDEEQAGRALGQAQVDLGGEVALDQRDHGQHGEPGAERHDHARRAGAGPVQVGERDAHARAAAPADQAHAAQHQRGEAGEQAGRAERHRDEDQPEPAVGDAGQREQREAERR